LLHFTCRWSSLSPSDRASFHYAKSTLVTDSDNDFRSCSRLPSVARQRTFRSGCDSLYASLRPAPLSHSQTTDQSQTFLFKRFNTTQLSDKRILKSQFQRRLIGHFIPRRFPQRHCGIYHLRPPSLDLASHSGSRKEKAMGNLFDFRSVPGGSRILRVVASVPP
jgi:hypothetical protein